jgi:hypothetical protein
VIAARWAALLVAALMVLAALGASDPDLQPSALRLMATSVVGLLAPLFWPGVAATHQRTAVRIVAWSAAAAVLAALVLGAFGNTRQSLLHIAEACAMLWLVLLVAHAATALLESGGLGRSGGARTSREMAGRAVVMALAAFGSLPLWLGPAAETLSSRHGWAIDALLDLSPVVHLAMASGNDLLRNQWFYQHSNIASLQFEYPGLVGVAWSYALLLAVLGLLAMMFWHRRLPVRIDPMERT